MYKSSAADSQTLRHYRFLVKSFPPRVQNFYFIKTEGLAISTNRRTRHGSLSRRWAMTTAKRSGAPALVRNLKAPVDVVGNLEHSYCNTSDIDVSPNETKPDGYANSADAASSQMQHHHKLLINGGSVAEVLVPGYANSEAAAANLCFIWLLRGSAHGKTARSFFAAQTVGPGPFRRFQRLTISAAIGGITDIPSGCSKCRK